MREDDPPTLEIEPLDMGGRFAKYSAVERGPAGGDATGAGSVAAIAEQRPDVVLSGDTPLFAQAVDRA